MGSVGGCAGTAGGCAGAGGGAVASRVSTFGFDLLGLCFFVGRTVVHSWRWTLGSLAGSVGGCVGTISECAGAVSGCAGTVGAYVGTVGACVGAVGALLSIGAAVGFGVGMPASSAVRFAFFAFFAWVFETVGACGVAIGTLREGRGGKPSREVPLNGFACAGFPTGFEYRVVDMVHEVIGKIQTVLTPVIRPDLGACGSVCVLQERNSNIQGMTRGDYKVLEHDKVLGA